MKNEFVKNVARVIAVVLTFRAGAGVLQEIGQDGTHELHAEARAGATTVSMRGTDPRGFRGLLFGSTPAVATNAGLRLALTSARRGGVEYAVRGLAPYGGVQILSAALVYAGSQTGECALVHVRIVFDGNHHRQVAGALRRRFGPALECREEEGVQMTWFGTATCVSFLYLYGGNVQVDFISRQLADRMRP